MDLKALFGDKALTYDQFQQAAAGKKMKLVDLSEGGYVDKHKLDDKAAELGKANETIKGLQETVKKFDGVDVDALKKQVTDAQTKYDTDVSALKRDSAVNLALVGAKARDVKAVRPFLDFDTIKLGDKGGVLGLDEQLQKLKTEKAFLFEDDKSGDGKTPEPSAAHVDSAGEHHESPDAGLDAFVAGAMKGAGIQSADNGGKK
ncbi:MAG: phage scaffolding protein [Oscillospiraceae bacterium]|jgi:hypothetical protein|nr:phage scaffolding protein [Oscillospiraceae bacterium]MCI1990013.1 phage scaffolding protein [Oscillospiraceae bacterium]MCI2034815.1 phage scaffolding protein [Oscillospiraceae bacterium]